MSIGKGRRRVGPARAVTALSAATLAATLVAGCATAGGGLSGEPSSYGATSARGAVEAFLEGARQREYTRMGRHFGTREGPAEARLGLSEVEQRMIVLAGLLRHDTARLRREDLAQHGPHRARFVATLTGTRSGRVSVPLVAVTTPGGRWFVERVVVDALNRSVGG